MKGFWTGLNYCNCFLTIRSFTIVLLLLRVNFLIRWHWASCSFIRSRLRAFKFAAAAELGSCNWFIFRCLGMNLHFSGVTQFILLQTRLHNHNYNTYLWVYPITSRFGFSWLQGVDVLSWQYLVTNRSVIIWFSQVVFNVLGRLILIS